MRFIRNHPIMTSALICLGLLMGNFYGYAPVYW